MKVYNDTEKITIMNIIQTGIREREIIFAKIGNIPTFYKIGNGKSERWGKITEGQKKLY